MRRSSSLSRSLAWNPWVSSPSAVILSRRASEMTSSSSRALRSSLMISIVTNAAAGDSSEISAARSDPIKVSSRSHNAGPSCSRSGTRARGGCSSGSSGSVSNTSRFDDFKRSSTRLGNFVSATEMWRVPSRWPTLPSFSTLKKYGATTRGQSRSTRARTSAIDGSSRSGSFEPASKSPGVLAGGSAGKAEPALRSVFAGDEQAASSASTTSIRMDRNDFTRPTIVPPP